MTMTPSEGEAMLALDVKSMSQSTRDGRCLELWFAQNITDADRACLLEAINAYRAAAQTSGMREALAFPAALERVFEDHYWDTFQEDRNLILNHVRAVLREYQIWTARERAALSDTSQGEK